MPIFNKKSYKNFSEVIASSYEYLKAFDQETEYFNLRKNILAEAKKYNYKNYDFLEKVWLKRTKQGIANTTNNGFDEDKFKNNINYLHEMTINIKNDCSYDSYLSAIEALSVLKNDKKKIIKYIYKAQIARAFCTFHPDKFVNWVSDGAIRKVLKIFSEFDDLNLKNIKNTEDWYIISSKIRLSINRINLSLNKSLNPEDIRILITQVYLQNSEASSALFDRAVSKYRKAYEKNGKASECPEGNAVPDVIYESGVTRFIRCPKVKAWILTNTNGKCEGCPAKAPFKDAKGFPYLEVHHMKHLANKGSDTPSNTVALCPNCHRAIHFSEKKEAIIKKIYRSVKRLKME